MPKKTNSDRRLLRSYPSLPTVEVSLKNRELTVHTLNGNPYHRNHNIDVYSACWLNDDLYFVIQSQVGNSRPLQKVHFQSTANVGPTRDDVAANVWINHGFAAVHLKEEELLFLTEQDKILRQPLALRRQSSNQTVAAWSPSMPVLAILDEKGLGIWRPELNTIETQYLWESLDIARRVDQSEILWSPNGQSLIIVREHLPRMSYEQMEAASPKEIEQYLESRMTDVAVLQTAPRREVLRTESLPRLTLIEWEDDVAYRTRQHLPGRFNDAYLRRLVHSQN